MEKISKKEVEKQQEEKKIHEQLRLSLSTNNDGKRAERTALIPSYNTSQYTPKNIAENIKKAQRVNGYLDKKNTGILLSDNEKEKISETIYAYRLTKESIITSDICSGMYKYITTNQNIINELIDKTTQKVIAYKLTIPFSTFKKITYGDAIVDKNGEFRHSTAELMNKHIEPTLNDLLTHKIGVPYLIATKKKENEDIALFYRSPFSIDGVDTITGNINLTLDAFFFPLAEDTERMKYTAGDRYITSLAGLYPLLILGHNLQLKVNKTKNMPSPITAYRYITLLNCTAQGQSILGFQREIDEKINKNRLNIKINLQEIQKLFTDSTSSKDSKNGKKKVYCTYKQITSQANLCGIYLLKAIEKLKIIDDLKKDEQFKDILLPVIENSAQFLPSSKRDSRIFLTKGDKILNKKPQAEEKNI